MITRKEKVLIRYEVIAAFLGGVGLGGFLLGPENFGVPLSIFLISVMLLFKSFIYSRWKRFRSEEDKILGSQERSPQ